MNFVTKLPDDNGTAEELEVALPLPVEQWPLTFFGTNKPRSHFPTAHFFWAPLVALPDRETDELAVNDGQKKTNQNEQKWINVQFSNSLNDEITR